MSAAAAPAAAPGGNRSCIASPFRTEVIPLRTHLDDELEVARRVQKRRLVGNVEVQHVPEANREMAYKQWLHTTVDKIAKLVQRKQGEPDFAGMPRLERNLKNILIAVGTAIGSDRRHLPLGDAFVLLNFNHPRHGEVYERIKPRLDREVLADFEREKSLPPKAQEENLQSTINRLRSLFSPIVRAILSETDESINFRRIIDQQQALIVNLKPTIYFSEEQGDAIGGLIINEIISTVRATPTPEDCRRHYLIIDEASRFVGQDLISSLKQDAKRKLSVCLAGQDFSAFRKGDIDMVPDLCGNTWSFISFQQKENENVQELAKYFLTTNVVLDERYQPMVVPIEPRFEKVIDRSWGHSEGTSESVQRSRSEGESESESRATHRAQATNWGESQSRSETVGTGVSSGAGVGSGISNQLLVDDGRVVGSFPSMSSHHNQFQNQSSFRAQASATGSSRGGSDSQGESHGTSAGRFVSNTTGATEGRNESRQESFSEKTILIPQHRIDQIPTGQPRFALDYQQAMYERILATLPVGNALMRTTIDGHHGSFLIRVRQIEEPYPKPRHKRLAIEEMKEKARKPYHRTPTTDEQSQDARIDRFLGADGDGDSRLKSKREDDDHPFAM